MSQLKRNLALRLDLEGTEKDLLPASLLCVKTKIVCTIGPKTKSPEMLTKMMEAGMNVARLNFSHGTHEYHGGVVDNVRTALKENGRQCAIMLDTKGPEIRTGKLKDKNVELKTGQKIAVTVDNTIQGDGKMISLDYKALCTSVKPGYQILIADGLISLSVESIDVEKGVCQCVVNNTATLGETKNVHLPGAIVDLPAVSEQDTKDILFGVQKNIDCIAASFIRKPDDILQIRQILGEAGKQIRIVAKIESIERLQNFDAILAVADGIMVARGDLGVELPMEQIFIAQKMMISKCNAVAKPVITATQMLESMIQNPKPTRAEATDVANAVIDGTDCVMLSGETASGDYPLQAIRIMKKICYEAERIDRSSDYPKVFSALVKTTPLSMLTDDEYSASYCVRTAIDLRADIIVVVTSSGHSARMICKYRPLVPVICVTSDEKAAMALLLTKGAIPVLVPDLGVKSGLLVEAALKSAKALALTQNAGLLVLQTGSEGLQTQTVKVLRY
jgi:pyruvate kinase